MSEAKKLPQPVDGVMDIAAYVPGSSKAPTGVKLHKLSSNETPLGSSPKAQQALADFAGSLEIYPDGSATKLREAISQAHGLNAENILCGNGSDEILAMIASAYLSAGDEAIYTEHGFLVYEIEILANSAKPVVVKERDLTCDVDAILAAVTPKTKIVFLANPNNPTGTYVPAEDVRCLHAGLPSNVILVLDAAYAEYVRRNDYQAGIELVSSSDNVVMTRTFSKIHGLAGLRVGWCYGPKAIIDTLNRIRGPFNMNSAAIEAGSAAIQDKAFVESAVDHNEKWLEWTTKELEKIGLKITPSVGNFILIHFTENEGRTAVDANDYLVERGMVLRLVAGYGLPNALRMTIGTEEANRAVVGALTAFLDE